MKNPAIKVLVALACFGLTLTGVAGLAYKIFNPDGWLVQALGYVWDLELHFSIMAIPVLIAAVVLGKLVFSGFFNKLSGKFGNWLTGAFMALGMYFVVRVIFYGGL